MAKKIALYYDAVAVHLPYPGEIGRYAYLIVRDTLGSPYCAFFVPSAASYLKLPGFLGVRYRKGLSGISVTVLLRNLSHGAHSVTGVVAALQRQTADYDARALKTCVFIVRRILQLFLGPCVEGNGRQDQYGNVESVRFHICVCYFSATLIFALSISAESRSMSRNTLAAFFL